MVYLGASLIAASLPALMGDGEPSSSAAAVRAVAVCRSEWALALTAT